MTQQQGPNGHPAGSHHFTEAPASINLKFDYRGYRGVMLTLRAGSGLDLLTKLDPALDTLEKMGATPAAGRNGRVPTAANGANGNAPACKYHGEMRRSKRFSGWYCPAKMGDGSSYCQEKVMD
jgi:hypothetical protein